MKEIFKDIKGYENSYQVSNLGNVKSKKRTVYRNGRFVTISKRILKQNKTGAGYLAVNLSLNGNSKTKKIHQLVAVSFLGHEPDGNKTVVDHINNDKLDNRLVNLQLINHRENLSKDKKNGSSKYIGVSWYEPTGKWVARMMSNKIKIHIGYFKDEYKAHLAYQNKLAEISNPLNR